MLLDLIQRKESIVKISEAIAALSEQQLNEVLNSKDEAKRPLIVALQQEAPIALIRLLIQAGSHVSEGTDKYLKKSGNHVDIAALIALYKHLQIPDFPMQQRSPYVLKPKKIWPLITGQTQKRRHLFGRLKW